MKNKKHLFLLVTLIASALQLFAQKEDERQNATFTKLNLTSIVLKNYSLQVERTLSKRISAAISYRVMPTTAIPFKSQIITSLGDNNNSTKDLINNLQLSNNAITPEVRIYLGKKGYGRGFYIAPFYRYAVYKSNTLKVDFTGETGAPNSLNLSGSINTNTAGVLFGAQWAVGNHFCIDWWIAGPHYGAGKGDFSGLSSKPLTQNEQDELKRQIDNINVPFSTKTITVNAAGATMHLDGPWAGVRAGLLVGVRF